ncbi:hypothetical protein CPB85DRAFT_839902 [Mucidula mucida]|nr:hypothetical protein CPB85DRAFT_839902 [Mucidula mucida]
MNRCNVCGERSGRTGDLVSPSHFLKSVRRSRAVRHTALIKLGIIRGAVPIRQVASPRVSEFLEHAISSSILHVLGLQFDTHQKERNCDLLSTISLVQNKQSHCIEAPCPLEQIASSFNVWIRTSRSLLLRGQPPVVHAEAHTPYKTHTIRLRLPIPEVFDASGSQTMRSRVESSVTCIMK